MIFVLIASFPLSLSDFQSCEIAVGFPLLVDLTGCLNSYLGLSPLLLLLVLCLSQRATEAGRNAVAGELPTVSVIHFWKLYLLMLDL